MDLRTIINNLQEKQQKQKSMAIAGKWNIMVYSYLEMYKPKKKSKA